MRLLNNELKRNLPKLYSQEEVKDPMVLAKFFDPYSSWTWYVIEGEEQEDGDWIFFGLVDGLESELGYFSLNELQSIEMFGAQRIERDLYFEPCKLSDIKN